ncbi:hypothetical protein, partial [Mycoplasmopsis bovis]|uniref:hypothetical protein n=1 Tax=Mycoplasmopsis bovis TaxID=28903 RepID=UPI003D2B77EA
MLSKLPFLTVSGDSSILNKSLSSLLLIFISCYLPFNKSTGFILLIVTQTDIDVIANIVSI